MSESKPLVKPVRWGVSSVAAPDRGFALPSGTVTLLLTDIEGSTRLWEQDGAVMSAAVARFGELLDGAVAAHEGVRPEEQGEGDSAVAAFSRASDALASALELQLALTKDELPFKVRVGLHTGEVQLRDAANYIGTAINRAARLRDTAHGGQIVLSQATHDLVIDELQADVSLEDLGSHRLKDLARPEHVYQVCHPRLPAEFPALRSLESLPNNLPTQLTTFIGREGEIAKVKGLLRETRLLTLTGSGGCGKTRLAAQVGAELLENNPEGVWWVDLAPLSEGGKVAYAVAAVLRVKESMFLQISDEGLAHFVGSKTLALILDNCEHLVEACAGLVDVLLHSCPGLTVLTTSREPLAVPGEVTWRVPSLSLPDPSARPAIETLTQCEAVRLFIDRALRARPNFRVTNDNAPAVAQVCQRLDGIPLAIELAAARSRMLSPEQIAEGLDDRFRLLTGGGRTVLPRLQTLRASVDWSYELLSEPEKTLLVRTSIFAGGFTLDAAEAVCSGDGIDAFEVLELLSRLVDRSLVVVDEADGSVRYGLLETIRQYGLERLAVSGEVPALRRRHRDHFLALAVTAEPHLLSAEYNLWARMLDRDLDNLRAALDWSRREGHAIELATLAVGLSHYWFGRSLFAEGRAYLDLPALDLPPALHAETFFWRAMLAATSLDVPAAVELGQQALKMARELGDERLIARAQAQLSLVAVMFLADAESGRGRQEEAERLGRGVGDAWALTTALIVKGLLLFLVEGRGREAREALEESVAVGRPAVEYIARVALIQLGLVRWFGGDIPGARSVLEDAIESSRREGEAMWLGVALAFLASVLAQCESQAGDDERALELLGEAVRIGEETRNPICLGMALALDGHVRASRGRWEEARSALERADPFLAAFPETVRPGNLAWLAEVLWHLGQREKALQVVEEAVQTARPAGRGFALPSALRAKGRLLRWTGDAEGAEAAHCELLSLEHETMFAPDTLEALAGLAAGEGSAEFAARLFGSAESLRAALGLPRTPADVLEYEADVATAREGMDAEAFETAWSAGAAMTLEEAIAYATRGRGARKRPTTGWRSLTPTELNVTELVAEGLTNPQIAERLFIAPGTVRIHLSHIFAKLGISRRAELAAEATRRGDNAPHAR